MESDPDPRPEVGPKKRGPSGCVVRLLLWGFVALFLLLAGALPLLIETAFHLAFGWVSFLRRNFGEIRFAPDRIATALILGSCAVAGLHLLARAWWHRMRPSSGPWRWGWSAAIALSLLAFSLAAISVAGTAHQVAWLKSEEKFEMSYPSLKRSLVYLRRTALDMNGFAEEHEGRFPDNIAELVAWVHDSEFEPWMAEHYFLYQQSSSSTPEPWLYFGTERSKGDEPFLLLASPRPNKGKRLAAMSDGVAQAIAEDEFQSLLTKQNLPSPAPDSSKAVPSESGENR